MLSPQLPAWLWVLSPDTAPPATSAQRNLRLWLSRKNAELFSSSAQLFGHPGDAMLP